jgi:hypothetical protein
MNVVAARGGRPSALKSIVRVLAGRPERLPRMAVLIGRSMLRRMPKPPARKRRQNAA